MSISERAVPVAFGVLTVALWVLTAILVVVLMAGCKLGIVNDNRNDNRNGGCATCTPTPPAGCADLTCARAVNPGNGLASEFRVQHSCGVLTLTCTRASDGLSITFPSVGTGVTIDPGPPGAGGGTWTCTAGAATCQVILDS